jgi:hypothetical protein
MAPTEPTTAPTKAPTTPTEAPTKEPTIAPTAPTKAPTKTPTAPTKSPTAPTKTPTKAPTKASDVFIEYTLLGLTEDQKHVALKGVKSWAANETALERLVGEFQTKVNEAGGALPSAFRFGEIAPATVVSHVNDDPHTWPLNLDMNTLMLDNIIPDEMGVGRLSGPSFRFNYSFVQPVPGNPVSECWLAQATCLLISLMFSRCCTFRFRQFRSKVYTEEWEQKMQATAEHESQVSLGQKLALGPMFERSQPSANTAVQFHIYKFGGEEEEGDHDDDEGAMVVKDVSVKGQAAAAVARLKAKADAAAAEDAKDEQLSELDLKIKRAEQKVRMTMKKKFDLVPMHDKAPGLWEATQAPWGDSVSPWTAKEVATAKNRADARGRLKLKPLGEISTDFKQLKKAEGPTLNAEDVKNDQLEGKMVFFGGKGDIDMMLLNVGKGNDLKPHAGISDEKREDQQYF